MRGQLWLIWLLLAAAAGAEPRPLLLRVFPPQTQLRIEEQVIAGDPYAGFVVSREQLPSRDNRGKVLFQFSAPGWTGQNCYWSWNDLEQPLGELRLQPASLSAYWSLYPGRLAGAGLLTVAALLGLVRRERRTRELERQDEILSGYMASANLTDPLLLCTLGGYRLVKRLGSGGMSDVYLGLPQLDLDESQARAIKVMRAGDHGHEFSRRFEREILISSQLRHPHIVRVYGGGVHEGMHFLVMERVHGGTLTSFIGGQGLTPAQSLGWLDSLVEALHYAHELGVVHRDLKPDNVMIDESGHLRLMDFGLARNQEVATVTATGLAMGTPAYIAPEQLSGGSHKADLTPLSDQYSLGVLVYEMLSGHRPFEADDPMTMVYSHLQVKPEPIRTHRPELSAALEAALQRMLSKNPADRFASVREAGEALRLALIHENALQSDGPDSACRLL